jgi:hypothetical protein
MGQFDRETDAALVQLENEALAEMPGAEFAEIIGDLLMLVGTGGLWAIAGGASDLALKVRKLAGASYASNLIYAITAVRNDLKTLYDGHENLRQRIESLGTDPKFAEAISALALRAMHTSVKDRLKRLARIVANGVKEGDLEIESLDDMMRAAVELKQSDLLLLRDMYDAEPSLSRALNLQDEDTALFQYWQDYWDRVFPQKYPAWPARLTSTGFGRLAALGLIYGTKPTNLMASPVPTNYRISEEGKKFYERLQEIAVK